jgi:hypothetical protein
MKLKYYTQNKQFSFNEIVMLINVELLKAVTIRASFLALPNWPTFDKFFTKFLAFTIYSAFLFVYGLL